MRLKQEMPTVQDVRFHAWEVLHPGERFGDVEEGVVAAPDHQRRRLPLLQIGTDRMEVGNVIAVVRKQGALHLHAAGQVQDPPVLDPGLAFDFGDDLCRHVPRILVARAFEGEKRGRLGLVFRSWIGPEREGRFPLRRETGAMGVGALNDEARHQLGGLHGDPQSDRCTPIV
jgi:hypothetical protein